MSVIQKSQQDAAPVIEHLAAIVPLYNERGTVIQLLSLLIQQEVVFQVVIVDDASTDLPWDPDTFDPEWQQLQVLDGEECDVPEPGTQMEPPINP